MYLKSVLEKRQKRHQNPVTEIIRLEGSTAFAESEYNGSGTEGPAEYVLDEDEGTHWHTNWAYK